MGKMRGEDAMQEYQTPGRDNVRTMRTTKRLTIVAHSPQILDLAESYRLRLRAERKSSNTIIAYLDALYRLNDFLTAQHLPTEVGKLSQGHIETFIIDQLERLSAGTANCRFSRLRTFFAWCVHEGEIAANPMELMKSPPSPDHAPEVPTTEDLKRLLASVAGRGFTKRRDRAIFLLLIDTGMRRAELARLVWSDIDMDQGRIRVQGKRTAGRDRSRVEHISHVALAALDAYKRERSRHKYAALPAVFLGQRGGLTGIGIYQIIGARARAAGLPGLHPHLFRHYFATSFLELGGQESDLRELAGWDSDVARRYLKARRRERAIKSHEQFSPGDQF